MPQRRITDIPDTAEVLISCFIGGADLIGIITSCKKLRTSYDRPLIWRSMLSDRCNKSGNNKKIGKKSKKHTVSNNYKALFVAYYIQTLFDIRKRLNAILEGQYEQSICMSFYQSAVQSICGALSSGLLPVNETKKSCAHSRLICMYKRTVYPDRHDSRELDKLMGSNLYCCLCRRRCYEKAYICICPDTTIIDCTSSCCGRKLQCVCYCTACNELCEIDGSRRLTGHYRHPVQQLMIPTTYLYDREYTVGCFGCATAIVVKTRALHKSRISFTNNKASVISKISDNTVANNRQDDRSLVTVTFLCNSSQNDFRNMLRTEAGNAELLSRMRGSSDMILTSQSLL